MTKLTKKQARELAIIAAMPDDQIDLSDFPEITQTAGSVRGRFYRPVTMPTKAAQAASPRLYLANGI